MGGKQLGFSDYELTTARKQTKRESTIVDATLIAAPSSTKNIYGKRDPEMHQIKKGNQWYCGMKVHAGVDRTQA